MFKRGGRLRATGAAPVRAGGRGAQTSGPGGLLRKNCRREAGLYKNPAGAPGGISG